MPASVLNINAIMPVESPSAIKREYESVLAVMLINPFIICRIPTTGLSKSILTFLPSINARAIIQKSML